MALSIAEKAPASPKIVKQYRLVGRGGGTGRTDEGCAYYRSINDPEGTTHLTVHPDGSKSSWIVVGVCCWCQHAENEGVQGCGYLECPCLICTDPGSIGRRFPPISTVSPVQIPEDASGTLQAPVAAPEPEPERASAAPPPPPDEPVTRLAEPSAERQFSVFRSPYRDDEVVSPSGVRRINRALS